MFGRISSSLTSNVKGYCSSTAIADVTSAVSVLEYYCSAAASKVVATVSESISEASGTRAVPSRTKPGSSLPSQTGAGGSGGSGDQSDSGTGNSGGKGNKVAVIAASVLGAVVAIVIVAGLIWYFRRRNQRKQRGEQLPAGNTDGPPGGIDPSKYPGQNVVAELSTPSHTPRPELQGNATSYPSELPPHHWSKSELQGDAMHGGQHLRPTQSPHELMTPTSGYQVSPQSATLPSYSSPTTVSPHHGQHPGYWGPQTTESYELATNVPRS